MRTLIVLSALVFVLPQAALGACIKATSTPANLTAHYQSAAGTSGENLKAALNSIIRGHRKHSYKCVWTILKEADEDPQNPSNVIGFYTGRSIPKSEQDSGGSNMDAWNREHIWAKSKGFPRSEQHGYTDTHHLRAADKSVNTDRSNNDFDNGGTLDNECTECREGSGTWEAPNRVKGDVARMMFYMATRYEGNDSSSTPDLELVDRNTNSGEPFFGKLCTLLEWHRGDAVSNEERQRNNIIYNWQGNRNPFIDHPEYVASIWGAECVTPDSTKEQLLDRIERVESELNELRTLIEESM